MSTPRLTGCNDEMVAVDEAGHPRFRILEGGALANGAS